MLKNKKSNANVVGVAAHTDPQTKRHYLNCLNNHNDCPLCRMIKCSNIKG